MATENPESRRVEEGGAIPEGTAPGSVAAIPVAGRVRERQGERTLFAESGAPVPGTSRPPMTPTRKRLLAFTWLASSFMLFYMLFVAQAFLAPGYSLVDRIASVFLVLGTLFIMIHSMGYANSMVKASWGYNEVRRRAFTPQVGPKVACVLATFNEPAEVVEETVAALVNMEYANKEIVILDDSTREESRQAMREIAARYGVICRQRTSRKGYKAGAINEFLQETDAGLIAVFDADAVPAHNFLRDLVPIIEENPRLAFVQTPQHYANVEHSGVALAAARQQNVFYEYICEGKSYSRAAFCCGTNFIARRAAILDVGGMDDSTVTEDLATSINLHVKGWDSAYYNQVYVYGLGPETLDAYFTQQKRWAFGSVKNGWNLLKAFFRGPQRLRLGQWWEYSLSTSYYWVGLVNLIFMILPLLYIFFGIKPLRQDVFTYLMLFVPYLIFSMNMFYMGMEQRGYRLTDMLLGQQANFLCFPVHIQGAISGFFGLTRPFGVTPKGSSGRMNWLALWPQLLMLVISAIAFVYGIYRYVSGYDKNTSAILINSLWALYHVFLLSGVFRLNRVVSARQQDRYFDAPVTTNTPTAVGDVPVTRVGAVAPPPATVRRTSGAGHLALGLALLTLLGVICAGLTMAHWATSPITPVNVYMVDRTVGRDYQEHRALTWTLNFLKVRQDGKIYPGDSGSQSPYNFARDYFGFVPQIGEAQQPVAKKVEEDAGADKTAVEAGTDKQAELIYEGTDRPLPTDLATPGVLYLADTTGEFVEYDYKRGKYVRYRNPKRGILQEDVPTIKKFYENNGLLIGEWNSVSNPTQFTDDNEVALVQRGFKETQAGLKYLQEKELPQRERDLALARRYRNKAGEKALLEQINGADGTKARIERHKQKLKELGVLVQEYDAKLPGAQAQEQVAKMLHVKYRGWYGRFVDHFEEEREYDYQMWKNVLTSLQKRYPDRPSIEPQGPGFVFYRDGASKVYNPETKALEDNPFSEPIVITQEELGEGSINDLAAIHRSGKEGVADDPLLKNVEEQVPYHYWFDVVDALPGSRTLAWYKLRVKKTAADRLLGAGFPPNAVVQDKTNPNLYEITLPALVAAREGDASTGALRSLYFAGDASDYSLVPRFAELAPSTGGIAYFLGHRAGPFSMQYYWNYYQPVLQNVFASENGIRNSG